MQSYKQPILKNVNVVWSVGVIYTVPIIAVCTAVLVARLAADTTFGYYWLLAASLFVYVSILYIAVFKWARACAAPPAHAQTDNARCHRFALNAALLFAEVLCAAVFSAYIMGVHAR